MHDKEPSKQSPEPNLITRRGLFKASIATAAAAGSWYGAHKTVERIADNTPDRPREKPPVPTGYPLFDVYGNKVDSNELLNDGYAEAVKYEEQRQEENDN